MLLRIYRILLGLFIITILLSVHQLSAQPNSYLRLDYKDKPSKYEMKVLPAEKSGEGELHGLKKFMQSTYTHYNFLFNANRKIEDALAAARAQHVDDYNQLLTFDNYDTSVLARNYYLDSAIEKSNGSLLLHDIRNEWNDEVYLLLGKSFYYKNQLDSAAAHFQYLNYAFAPKDDGYDIPIASNESNANHEISIASPKPKGLLKHAPRRNEGLLWLARTLIMEGHITTGQEILQMMSDDKQLPKKLIPLLLDDKARAFYFSKQYDSAAIYIDSSEHVAVDVEDRSRRKYLSGQLFLLANHPENAIASFGYAANHSSNIVLEINARLRLADLNVTNENHDEQLDKLIQLSKKSKYKDYRPWIYYLVGMQYLQKGDSINAYKYFKDATISDASALSNTYSVEYKGRSYQKMGDMEENRFRFRQMVANYDSIKGTWGDNKNVELLSLRKIGASLLEKQLQIIYLEDSLQALSNLPKSEQDKVLKKQLRQIHKLLGIQEQDNSKPTSFFANNTTTTTDLFSGVTNKSGEWYFNNNDAKAQGYQSFITRFGARPNVDNWIRQSAVNGQIAKQNISSNTDDQSTKVDSSSIDLDYLRKQLLLTPESIYASKMKVAKAYLAGGKIMQNQLTNYEAAIWFYKKAILIDTANNLPMDDLLFHMASSYHAIGQDSAAEPLMKIIRQKYPNSKYLNSNITSAANNMTSESSTPGKTYKGIYDDFLSGDFEKAKKEKLHADSIFGNIYWTPQLLFIESVYYVSEREDSTAISKLNTLIQRFGNSPIKEKAETLKDVVSRRKEIETYLTNLKITKDEDEDDIYIPKKVVDEITTERKKEIKVIDTTDKTISNNQSMLVLPKMAPLKSDTTNGVVKYAIDVDKPHFVMLVLNKVAKVFATEAGNAFNRFNKQNFYNQELPIQSEQLDDSHYLTLIGPFKDAGDAYLYIDKVAPVTPQRILPWLTKDKYNFSMISLENLEILKKYKTLEDYQKTLHDMLPGKF